MKRFSTVVITVFVISMLIIAAPMVSSVSAQWNYMWIREKVDVREDWETGWYTSIALDSNGNPHISYVDAYGGSLMYASKIGDEWNKEFVDWVGSVYALEYGDYEYSFFATSLALDEDDVPHISYYNFGTHNLMHATKIGDTWDSEVVYSSPYGNWVGTSSSIAVDQLGNPHIAYIDYTTSNAFYTYVDWISGEWTEREFVDGWASPDVSLALNCSFIPNFNCTPHISHRSLRYGVYRLRYVTKIGGTWIRETVNDTCTADTSIALDEDNNPHISWAGMTNYLGYAVKIGDTWYQEKVETGMVLNGRWNSLALDSNNNPHISYYDVWGLKYATIRGDTWNFEYVDGPHILQSPNVGWWSSIGLDADNRPHISYYNMTGGHLLYATVILAPTVVAERVTASDEEGHFTVVIDAGSDKGAPVTSWTEILKTNIASYTVTLTDGDMVMVIEGQLLDPYLEGQLVLGVDPSGEIIRYEINIAPYEAPPVIPQFGLTVAIVTSLVAMIYLTIRKRIGKKLE